jgi:hypothetical protein
VSGGLVVRPCKEARWSPPGKGGRGYAYVRAPGSRSDLPMNIVSSARIFIAKEGICLDSQLISSVPPCENQNSPSIFRRFAAV